MTIVTGIDFGEPIEAHVRSGETLRLTKATHFRKLVIDDGGKLDLAGWPIYVEEQDPPVGTIRMM